MSKLLSRTSITVDEAVAILLGWVKGPIEYQVKNEDPLPEELDCLAPLVFSLHEYLQDELDKLQDDIIEARDNNKPENIISEKQAALQAHLAETERANAYLCVIHDEINKGEHSALHVDTKLSSRGDTYITLSSFDEWAQQYGRTILAKLQKNSAEILAEIQPKKDIAAIPKPRTKMREQEEAILEMIHHLGYDALRLPMYKNGESGVKAMVCGRLNTSPLFAAKTAFKRTWESLTRSKEIIYIYPPPHK